MAGGQSISAAAERAIRVLEQAREQAPPLTSSALRLFTVEGQLNAIADLYERSKCEASRDEVAAQKTELGAIKLAIEVMTQIQDLEAYLFGADRLREYTDAIERKAGGGSTSFEPGFDPPAAPDSGAN